MFALKDACVCYECSSFVTLGKLFYLTVYVYNRDNKSTCPGGFCEDKTGEFYQIHYEKYWLDSHCILGMVGDAGNIVETKRDPAPVGFPVSQGSRQQASSKLSQRQAGSQETRHSLLQSPSGLPFCPPPFKNLPWSRRRYRVLTDGLKAFSGLWLLL